VKTSDRSYSVLLIFHRSFCWGFPIIRYHSCAKPELNPNTGGGTAKKITSSPYKKHCEVTQKNKNKQATKSKTWWLASNALLGPSERRKRRVCRDHTASDTPSDLDTELAVPHLRFDRRGWGTRRWLYVLYWSFLWRPQWRKLDTLWEILQMGAQTLCWYGGRFCLWALLGINTVLFLFFIFCNCNFLNSVTILCAFCVSYSPPQIRNTCAPN
jgi:hypothetical protein